MCYLLPPPVVRLLSSLLAATCLAISPVIAGCSAEPSREDPPPTGVDGPVDLADISILFPLPEAGKPDELLRASFDRGAGRVLLPRDLAARLPLLLEDGGVTYESLRVVSLRLEPCFREEGSNACKRQVRFVLQPVVTSPNGELRTLDAAAHVFYELGTATYVALVRALLDGRPRSAIAPLGVHPSLAKEGLAGPFAQLLKTRLAAAAGEGELVRATFMSLRGRGNEWQFGGFRVSGGGAVVEPLGITASKKAVQSLVLQTTQNSFLKSIAPAVTEAELAPLLDTLATSAASPAQLQAALAAANRIENPDLRSSEDTDCASCHTAASSRRWAERTLKVRSEVDRFASPTLDLSVTSPTVDDVGVLRAFGYFDRAPVISPRTIHDTANAARLTNRLIAETP